MKANDSLSDPPYVNGIPHSPHVSQMSSSSITYTITVVHATDLIVNKRRLQSRRFLAPGVIKVCAQHNPPFVNCGGAPDDSKEIPMDQSMMQLAYETALWDSLAQSVPPLGNCSQEVAVDGAVSTATFSPYCATCLSRNDFNLRLAYCSTSNPNAATECTCDVFFGGLNSQVPFVDTESP